MPSTSSFPGRLGLKFNELLRQSPNERILAEVVLDVNRGLLLTSARLIGASARTPGPASVWVSDVQAIEHGRVVVADDDLVKLTLVNAPTLGRPRWRPVGRVVFSRNRWFDVLRLLQLLQSHRQIEIDQSAVHDAFRAAPWSFEPVNPEGPAVDMYRLALAMMLRERFSDAEDAGAYVDEFISVFELQLLYGTDSGLPVGSGSASELQDGVMYLDAGGIPAFDREIQRIAGTHVGVFSSGSLAEVSHAVSFTDWGNAMSVMLGVGLSFFMHCVHWPHDAVESVHIVENARSAIHTSRSLIDHVAVGALFGGFGAVIGALQAMQPVEIQGSGLLHIKLRFPAGSHACLFTLEASRVAEVVAFFGSAYGARVTFASEQQDLLGMRSSASLAEQLDHLAELRERNVLSEEEFRMAKEKLLSD